MYPIFIPSTTTRSGFRGLADRRRTDRFPIEEDVKYKSTKGKETLAGCGKTLNIASNSVLFTTEQPLSVGRKVEVSINWPVLLDGGCLLKFVASGTVIRSEGDRAVIRIDRYEFRTRSSRPN